MYGVAGFGAQHTSCIGICRNVVGLCLIMILNILPFTVLYFFPSTDIAFLNARNTPSSKEKIPITMEELEEVVRLLAKYIATQKGSNLQKTDLHAHALLVKWNKYQRVYKNRIQHFLPRIGDHPDVILRNVISEWDPSSKKNEGVEVDIPVNFPPNIVAMYKGMNEQYVPSAPVKLEEAKLIRQIMALDVRFLHGCGLKWNASTSEEEAPGASGGMAPDAAPSGNMDRSRSPTPPVDPLNFSAWDICDIANIPFDSIVFSPDITLTSNRAYHAAAILFFLDPELPLKYPQVNDALHAGWTAAFKHPMNFEELRRPPCVGAEAYSDEEQSWCAATITFLVDSLDPAGRLSRGIPESAVSRRGSSRRAAAPNAGRPAAAAAAGPAAAAAAAAPRVGGGGGDGRRGGRHRRTETGDNEDSEALLQNDNTDTDNDLPGPTKAKGRKRSKSGSRYTIFSVFFILYLHFFT